MESIIEEIDEIKRVIRVTSNRKPRTSYYIYAALGTARMPSWPDEQENGNNPACIIDISATRPERQHPSSITSRDDNAPSKRYSPLEVSYRKPHGENQRPPPSIWKDDDVALQALLTLGLDETATLTNIKKQWRKLAQKLHPDKGGQAEVFIRARTAYETLMARSRAKAP